MIEEYEKKNNYQLDKEVEQQEVCCDENTHCVPNEENGKVINSNEKKMMNVDRGNYNNNTEYSHKGENCHSKNKIEELEKSHREQLILLKQNKQTIIDFIVDNADSIRVEDLKIYEPIYKCYLKQGYCFYCNTTTNIICKNCYNNSYNNNKEVWLCTYHWQDHLLQKE